MRVSRGSARWREPRRYSVRCAVDEGDELCRYSSSSPFQNNGHRHKFPDVLERQECYMLIGLKNRRNGAITVTQILRRVFQ
jgi:hypothetical protein